VRYVMAIPKNEVLPLGDGRTQEARQLWARVPGTLMERRSCADGAKGPRVYDFATAELADTAHGLARTLLIRRSAVPDKKTSNGELVPEVAYFLCHHDPGATLAELVTAAGQRWMTGETFQAAKNETGFDQHEVRKWCSWYRQTTVCMLALAFLADVRSRRIRPHHPATA
ncbi:IS701 family transposase, partial [Streptomyces sp. NPDC096030]